MRGTSLQQLTNVTAEELNTRIISSTSGRRWPLVLRIRHLSDSEARGWPQRAALATALAEEKCDHHAMMAAACLGPSCALWTASRSGRRPSPTLLSRARPSGSAHRPPQRVTAGTGLAPVAPAVRGRGGPIRPCPAVVAVSRQSCGPDAGGPRTDARSTQARRVRPSPRPPKLWGPSPPWRSRPFYSPLCALKSSPSSSATTREVHDWCTLRRRMRARRHQPGQRPHPPCVLPPHPFAICLGQLIPAPSFAVAADRRVCVSANIV